MKSLLDYLKRIGPVPMSGMAAMSVAVLLFIAPDVAGRGEAFLAFFFGGFGAIALLLFAIDALAMHLPIGRVSPRVWRLITLALLVSGPLALALGNMGGAAWGALWRSALAVVGSVAALGGLWHFVTKRFGARSARFFFASMVTALELTVLFAALHVGEGTFTETKPETERLHTLFFIGSLGITFALSLLWPLRCVPAPLGGMSPRRLVLWSLVSLLSAGFFMFADRRYLPGLYPRAHTWLEVLALGSIAAALRPWIGAWPMLQRTRSRKAVAGALGLLSAALVVGAVLFASGLGYMSNPYFRASVLLTASGPTLLDLRPTGRTDGARINRPMHHELLDVNLRHDDLAPPNDWNILMVTIDALRNDMLPRPGAATEHTAPNLAGLLNRCSDFRRTYAPGSRTALSMGALSLGRYSANIQWRPLIWYKRRLYNPRTASARRLKKLSEKDIKFTTLPRIPEGGALPMRLERAGLHTMATLFCGENRFFTPGLGFDKGYADYRDLSRTIDTKQPTSDTVAESAIAQVARAGDRRWFQWIHFYATHLGDGTRKRYIELVGQVDRALGKVLDGLEQSGQLARTAVLITADHGEGLEGEHRGGHASSVYDVQTRVPLLVCVPNGVPRRFDKPASGLDAVATILAIARADLTDIDGLNLLPFVMDGEPMPHRPVFTELHRFYSKEGKKTVDVKAIINGRWKLIHDRRRDTVELYDMIADPDEKQSIAAAREDVARQLKDALDVFTHNGDLMFRLTDFKAIADRIQKIGKK